MKRSLVLLAAASALSVSAQSTLRVNQVGYLPDDFKAAVYMGAEPVDRLSFELQSAESGRVNLDSVVVCAPWAPAEASARIYFSYVAAPGDYSLAVKDKATGAVLDVARLYIGSDAYSRHKLNELPLNYLRQQRCGYNPVHDAECHQHDGFVVLHDSLDGEHFDVRGGWHDASDYLQYLPTSANTVYQLLFAYRENPGVWADEYDAAGRPGANGVADILDEARWGLEWMMRMNPRPGLYFNQIADDRDHRFVGVPQADNSDYGRGGGKDRPIYPVSGKPYGLEKYKNRSNGEASSVAKFASAFALGAQLYAETDAKFAEELGRRARQAYEYALAHPGAAQTAPCVSPYFYEEDNWVDDMELAAASLGRLSPDESLAANARAYGSAERITPWMGADTARHYQWYPFINLGHFEAAQTDTTGVFASYYREGLEAVAARGTKNAFRFGVPFIWCSNNLTTALATQAMLYREMTGNTDFVETEAAARDWLFGVNPWGQTMIILPEGMVASSPEDPHSAMTDRVIARRPGRDWLVGGLVDGPVYTAIFNSLWGVHLRRPDKFEALQGPVAVYHDDYSDYSTNEPTMDGTASLSYMLGRLCGSSAKKTK